MKNYTRKTKKELLKRQLEINGNPEDFRMIVREKMIDEVLLDDSFAHLLWLFLFAESTGEEEELMILLNHTREKFKRMLCDD